MRDLRLNYLAEIDNIIIYNICQYTFFVLVSKADIPNIFNEVTLPLRVKRSSTKLVLGKLELAKC